MPHPGKMDADKFMEAYYLWASGQITETDMARMLEVKYLTLHYRLTKLFSTGKIPGNYFTDGKPMYLDFNKRIPKLGDCMEKRRPGNAWPRK